MPACRYRDRRAVAIENAELRVTVLEEGGHIAEIFDKRTGLNPLWTPPWPSIEPSKFEPGVHHATYGEGSEARLLSGIMGHNICLDFFGAPSEDEARAGLTVHGEAPVARYEIESGVESLTMRAELPIARLGFERQIRLRGRAAHIQETVENLTASDRAIGWTEHVTLGPPFLEKGASVIRASATRSRTAGTPGSPAFGADDYLAAGADFEWPHAPGRDSRSIDLQMIGEVARSSAYTAQLMDPVRDDAWFLAWSSRSRVAFGYVWRRADFPWLGIWEENASRQSPPWNRATLTRGMEFGVSPFAESRRAMIDRGTLFGVPAYRWIPARGRVTVEYWAVIRDAPSAPDSLVRPG
jgi:hypothetical protein